MFISQIFILSPRGDKLVFKDYRQDVPKIADEIFFRKFKFWDGKDHQAPQGDCPPAFLERGIHFFVLRRNGLLFVATSLQNVSASYVLEALNRITKITKDYLGVLNEEALRKNFTLVYELLDEVIDSGVVQDLTTEKLRPYIFNDVVAVKAEDDRPEDSFIDRIRRGELVERTKRPNATQFSVVQGSKDRKNEIYIDILERLNTTFNSQGNIISSEVDGSIIMKSFLAGTPDMFVSLNEDLVVGRGDRGRYATVVLDSVNFHEAADFSRFEKERLIMMRPPEGEFTVMNYRLTKEVPQPFRIIPSIEVQSSYKAELTLRIRGDFPSTSTAIQVSVRVPVPKTTTSLGCEYGVGATGQTHEFKAAEKYVTWNIARFIGGTEQVVKIRFSTSAPITAATRREVGPISMNFEIPMHSVSGLAIKTLRIEERSQTYNPQRWVRNITQANSYVTRMQ